MAESPIIIPKELEDPKNDSIITKVKHSITRVMSNIGIGLIQFSNRMKQRIK